MVELPRLPDGNLYPVCATCPAKAWDKDEGKYKCDSSRFTGPSGDVKRLRPTMCPQPQPIDRSNSSGVAYTLLRSILQR